jgi:hypothetical protein
MEQTRVNTQHFPRLLPVTLLFSSLLTLLSSLKCFNRSIFTEVTVFPCSYLSPGTISPKQSHQNQIIDAEVSIEKSLLAAGIEPGVPLGQ